MMAWLSDLPAQRSVPSLWVERLWLVESKEPLSVIREITLRPGLNIIWAREPDDTSATGRQAAGHGLGKTSFCLLLRYVLCDEADAITALRDEAQANFVDGGVAAQVHIGDARWTVFRPFSAHRQSLASRADTLDKLFSPEPGAQFDDFRQALHAAFVETLPITVLPGTNQAIEWRHLLAWCTRDQRTRFDGFFHWRSGEGVGFRRIKQDPPLLVRAALGILDTKAASLISDIESSQQELAQMDKRIEELMREPRFNLNRVEQLLRHAVSADASVPIEPPDLLTSGVTTMLDLASERLVEHERQIEAQIEKHDEVRQATLQEITSTKDNAEFLQLEKRRLEALLDGNQQEYDHLTGEIESLRQRKGRCSPGDVEFSECDHIRNRLSASSLRQARDEQALIAARTDYAEKLRKLDPRLKAVESDLARLRGRATELHAEARRNEILRATSVLERKRISDLREEYYARRRAQIEGTETDELALVRQNRSELDIRLQALQTKAEQSRHEHSARVSDLSALTTKVAERLLGATTSGWFDEHSDVGPFRVAVGGEAFHVLEVLIGDVVCLVDAVTDSANGHPGFLMHDCPREADMGSHLYQDFLVMFLEIEQLFSRDGLAPFQYLLTTTSPPPEELRVDPYLRLELRPDDENCLLFKRQLQRQTSELVK